MSGASPKNEPIWTSVSSPKFPKLTEDATVDVAIVGAGIAGITTAYLLAREGRSVLVLDDGPVGGGMTCVTTAHLANALDDRYVEIERLRGRDGARLAAESHTAAIERIERIVADEGIDCDFVRLDGFLFPTPGESPDLMESHRRRRRLRQTPGYAAVSSLRSPARFISAFCNFSNARTSICRMRSRLTS